MWTTHASPSFKRTTLNSTADSSGIDEYEVKAAVKAMVSEITNHNANI